MLIAAVTIILLASAHAVRIHPRGATRFCLTAWSPDSNITIEFCDQPVGSQDWKYTDGRWQTTWLSGEKVCAAPDDDINTPPAPHPPAVNNGDIVVGRTCGSRPRESWTTYRPNTYQFHGIRMLTGHMCLDLPGGILENGNIVQVWKCSDYYNPNQVSY